MDRQYSAQATRRMLVFMVPDDRVPHPDTLAIYGAAFLGCALFGHRLELAAQTADIDRLLQRRQTNRRLDAPILDPTMQAPRRHPEPSRNLAGRMSSLGDLLDRIVLRPFRVSLAAHLSS